MSDVARTALIVNLLTEDNLPSYHREIATRLRPRRRLGHLGAPLDRRGGPARHRDARLPAGHPRGRPGRARAAPDGRTWPTGYESAHNDDLLRSLAYVSFQELATRVSHRNTGKVTGDPIADQLLARIAADENLHMIFYRNLLGGGARARARPDDAGDHRRGDDFEMPGTDIAGLPAQGRRDGRSPASTTCAIHHDDVVMPVLRHWKVFELEGLDAEGEQARNELADFLAELEKQALRFEDKRDALKARMAPPPTPAAADPGRDAGRRARCRMGRMSTPSGPRNHAPTATRTSSASSSVTQDGMGVSEREGEENGATNPADLVEQPAKVMRIGSMIKQLLEEVRSAPLDEAGRARLAEIHQPLDRRARGRPGARAGRGARADHAAVPGRRRPPTPSCGSPRPSSSGGWRGCSTASRPRCSPSRWRPRRSCSRCARCRRAPATRRCRRQGAPGMPRPPAARRASRGTPRAPASTSDRSAPCPSDDRRAAGHADAPRR